MENIAQLTQPASVTGRGVMEALRGEPHAWLDVGHSRLAAWSFGSGPDLVFVHGWPLHSATYRHVVPHLADQFTCHLIDLPGVGRSTYTNATPFSIKEHAKTMLRAVELLGISRYGIVAQDSGAGIARWMAVGNAQVSGLVMANTEIPGHHGAFIEVARRLARSGAGRGMLKRFLGAGVVRRSSLGFRGCFTNPDVADGEFGRLFALPLLGDQAVFAGQMQLLARYDPREIDELETRHRDITAPVLMVWGAKDHYFPVKKARAMAGQFGGPVEFVELPEGKLFHHEEFPENFARSAAHHFAKGQ